MPPSLLRLSERWTYISLSMMKIYCIHVTDILRYDLLTNSTIARHMVMKPVLCLDTPPSPQYGMRAMPGP